MRPATTHISLRIRPVLSVFAVRMKNHWVLSYPLSALCECQGRSKSSLGVNMNLLVLFYFFFYIYTAYAKNCKLFFSKYDLYQFWVETYWCICKRLKRQVKNEPIYTSSGNINCHTAECYSFFIRHTQYDFRADRAKKLSNNMNIYHEIKAMITNEVLDINIRKYNFALCGSDTKRKNRKMW